MQRRLARLTAGCIKHPFGGWCQVAQTSVPAAVKYGDLQQGHAVAVKQNNLANDPGEKLKVIEAFPVKMNNLLRLMAQGYRDK